jgi:hypothetical protein
VPTLELLPPRSRRRRERPRWRVRDDDGALLGYVEEVQLRGARNLFYSAVAPHPVSGREVNLQLSTDPDERVEVLVRFRRDPGAFEQHLGPSGLRR